MATTDSECAFLGWCQKSSAGCTNGKLEAGCKPNFVTDGKMDFMVASRVCRMCNISPETSKRVHEIVANLSVD